MQKTAYEMRISDWSSDVCSSDRHPLLRHRPSARNSTMPTDLPTPPELAESRPTLEEVAELINHDKAFENTSTSVAASQMRNALNNLAEIGRASCRERVCAYV